MLEALLSAQIASAETRRELTDIALFASERRALGAAVPRRRAEFTSGRGCARRALAALGAPPVAIPSGPRGEPLWPAGIVGSITHCDGYRAAAVARSGQVRSLGIDAEPDLPLPEEVWEEVAHGAERDRTPFELRRLLFSAKEAVYKAWFPLTGRWLGFEDVELSLDPENARFDAVLAVPGPEVDGTVLSGFSGRWAVVDAIICTAVIVPAGA